MLTPNQIINTLKLEKHCEGGYFHRTFYSDKFITTQDNTVRRQLSSIYYLLTKDSHVSYFARNQSDLILYYHLGDPLKIISLNLDGSTCEKILGPDLLAGHALQIPCPANTCKAYELMGGEYCLISEAVAPGFEYGDMKMPSYAEITKTHSDHIEQIKKYIASPT